MGRPKTPTLPQAFPTAENETDQILALAKRSGVGRETIRAALKGERSPRLVAVDAIARALGLSVAELLTVGKAGTQDDSPFRTATSRIAVRAKSA